MPFFSKIRISIYILLKNTEFNILSSFFHNSENKEFLEIGREYIYKKKVSIQDLHANNEASKTLTRRGFVEAWEGPNGPPRNPAPSSSLVEGYIESS